MGWTLRNKYIVDTVFRDSLAKNEISYSRYLTTPTILNNVLWHCIAESDKVYFDGFYSLLDKKKEVNLYEIEKNHELITLPDDKRAKIIKWFTNDFYGVMVYDKDTIQVNDLRYGPYIEGKTDKSTDYIFPFLLYIDSETGEYKLKDQSGPPEGSMEEMWTNLIDRIKGK
jgi:inner membrane protein